MIREEAIKWLDNLTRAIGQMRHQDLWHYEQALSEISQMIDEMPDIVRCNDCRFYEPETDTDDINIYGCTNPLGLDFADDCDFCSNGERKETSE